MTVLEVLQSTTAYFKKRGIENPRLNAEHLIAHSLGKKRLDIYLQFERPLTQSQLSSLRELVRRRARSEPLQHLLGTIEFCGHVFLCDNRALVPRPETEELVELVQMKIGQSSRIAPGLAGDGKLSIIEVGTGSGVIALTLARKFPEAEVVATEISATALSLARENAARLEMAHVQFVQGDLLQGARGSFDVIVANLPYISRNDRGQLAPEVLRDPEIALFAGERGDEFIRRLIEEAPPHLRPGGLLALEIGLGQSDPLCYFLQTKNYRDIEAKKDYAGVIRFLFARHG